MKLYKEKRSEKRNPGFEGENQIQSSSSVENLNTGCQREICVFLYFAMSTKLSLTRRAHILISANHRMERFSTKNDPLVIFDKTSNMTLSEGIRNSFRICLANESYFTSNPLAAKDFLPYTFP